MSSNPVLDMTLEMIMEMPDEDLVLAGEVVTDELAIYRQKQAMIDGEIIRRGKVNEATRLVSHDRSAQVFANIQEGKPTYQWEAEKVRDLLAPKVTPEELRRAVKEKPPAPPPKAELTVHTQSVTALAKKVGLEAEVKKLCKVTYGPPIVKYERHEGGMGDDVEFD